VAADDKSNEITAIPRLLDRLDLSDALVTIDAMGCQKEIAAKIVNDGGDFVLAVKDNQPKLHRTIQDFFAEHLAKDFEELQHRHHATETSPDERKPPRQNANRRLEHRLPRRSPDSERSLLTLRKTMLNQ
jgi:predicted transposase YbfD/YdcC